jgi:hypothetical protein
MEINFERYHPHKLMDSNWCNSISWENLNKLKANYYYNNIDELYYTLYYPMNTDIVMCPKNASTVVRRMTGILNPGISRIYPSVLNSIHRREIIIFYKDTHPNKKYNFFHCREDSYKIAIKRDPIKRVISAAAWVTYLKIIDGKLNLTLKDTKNFNKKIIDTLDYCNELTDMHFISQTRFMGNVKYYDKVYNTNNMDAFFDDMILFYGRSKEINKLRNSKEEVLNVNSFYTLKPTDLPDSLTRKLKKIYEVDYDNGWY